MSPPAGEAAAEATVPADSSPALPEGRQQLDRRYVSVRRLVNWINVVVHAVVWSIGSVVMAFSSMPRGLFALIAGGWGLLVVLIALRAHFWPALSYRYASYRVGARELEIRRGVLWREVVTVPRSRVQHTDVSQGPLERAFSLGTLLIHTAGTDHARVALPGLTHELASVIRDHLVEVDEDDAV
ncbi:MAG: PH domain-containing protein [Acidobacteriota bacterium]